MQGFGLIFKDTFPRFGFSATDASIIINTNLAFGMILGLINGPLLRTFGYRKMAIIGSLFFCSGVIMTTFAKTFTSLIIFYGIFASLGTCMSMSAFSYALNSYFTTKKGRAMSLAMTIIGLGPIIIPQVTTLSISYYGSQGTILLYGAFILHSLVASTLLHPLKWHTKDATKSKTENEELLKDEKENKVPDLKENSLQEGNSCKNSMLDLTNMQRKRKVTISSIDHDAEIGSIYGIDIPYARQLSETLNVKSVDTVNLGSSIEIFEEAPMKKCISISTINMNNYNNTIENDKLLAENSAIKMSNAKVDINEKPEESSKWKIFTTISEYFDFDLLRDPIYVNLMLGMSIAIFAEINFSQLTPFFLVDMNITTKETATIMSVIASVDLVFRILAPFIAEWLHQPPKIMYLISLCLLILSRSSLLLVDGFASVIAVAIGLGAAKGVRSIYMTLVIPCYVPIHKLPNASGIQMIVNGVILLSAGPMLGVMRDSFGSYRPCIIVINFVTALTVTMWIIEILILRRKNLRKQSEQQEVS
ncbi:Monocarboxylate transporter 9 [Eufriesea mexicana]|uniref:Monocarboxylate transporter 9 n=1 Tax=Eufriesea mexicana TaxID=516756 RepID=A0A310S8Y9_9HYME|nr:Monocarboxylate transporter 9 [Eufriesea mexicana]